MSRPRPVHYGAVVARYASTSSSTRAGLFSRLQGLLPGAATASRDAEEAKAKEPKLEMRRLFKIVIPERNLIGVALAAQAVSATSLMLFPYTLGKVVDSVQEHTGAAANLDSLVLGMGAVFTVAAVATAVRVGSMSLAGSRVSRELRKQLFTSIMRQETAFFDRRQSGELVNRLSSDVAAVSRTLTDNLAKILRASITSCSSGAFLLYLSPKLSLVMLASIPPIVGFAFLFGRTARRLSRELVDALAAATQVAAERISAIRTVRMFGAEKFETRRYSSRVDATFDLARSVALADAVYSGSLFFAAQMSLLGVLWFGGHMVTDPVNPLTMGALTSFSIYALNLGVSISSVGTAYGQLTRALGAGHRVFEVIDHVEDVKRHSSSSMNEDDEARRRPLRRLEPGYEAIVNFENVSFAYPTQPDTPILNGVNLTVNPGEIVAVGGMSGSGKSTLLSLLSRLYTPTGGKILLGGQSIDSLDALWLRRQVAVVSQEPVLFNGTITENIRYAMTERVGMEQVEQAAKAAASHDMIMSLSNGYDTIVGERGSSLSGGQRARVALCRALVRNPRVLVLDEHSAALDAESERAVASALTTAATDLNIAVITIAHRLSSLRRANRVAVLSNGRVAENEPFDVLLERPGSLLQRMVYASGGDGGSTL